MSNAVIHGEWIGKRVRVVDAANSALVGLEGVVVDETKHLFTLETEMGEKRVPKHLTTFDVDWDGETVRVQGSDVLAAPEERIKRKVRR